MTTINSLDVLAARVEAATGPDRRLDAQIALACAPEYAGWIEHPAGNGNQWGELAPSREAFDEWLIRDGPPCLCSSPQYTGSIDAAMSLIPMEDENTAVFWRVGNDGEGGDPSLFKAQVLVATQLTSPSFTAIADTPALALCAAALRSHLEKQ